MAQQIINVGAAPNDGTGDTLRGAFIKTDENFDELYTNRISGSGTDNYVPRFNGTNALENSIIFDNGTNVGIGTTSPTSKLDVNGVIKGAGLDYHTLSVADGGAQLRLERTGSGSGLMYIGADNVGFRVYDASFNTRFLVASSGNVGIGTTSPSGKLDVFSTSDVYQNIITSGSGTSSVLSMYNSSGNTDGAAIGYNGAIRFGTITGVNAGGFSEKMRILANGNVGIGTTNILSKLNVTNSYYAGVATKANSAAFFDNQGVGVYIGGSEYSYGYIQAEQVDNTSLKNLVLQPNGGSVNIANLGTGLVYSNGGTLTSTNPSDERLKNNITDLQYGLIEILQLRPVSYNWKNDRINQGKQFGFIAQEVQQIMPDLISEFTTTENNEEVIRLGLDKEAIFVSMVNAIKELTNRINNLENK